jgi:hypothetical protein
MSDAHHLPLIIMETSNNSSMVYTGPEIPRALAMLFRKRLRTQASYNNIARVTFAQYPPQCGYNKHESGHVGASISTSLVIMINL